MNTNREKMLETKAWLKETAKKIREMKVAIKEYQRQNGGCYPIDWFGKDTKKPCLHRLQALQEAYRMTHIAYSLARGKTLEQIEPNHRKDENGNRINPPDMTSVNAYLMGLLVTETQTETQTA